MGEKILQPVEEEDEQDSCPQQRKRLFLLLGREKCVQNPPFLGVSNEDFSMTEQFERRRSRQWS